MTEGFPCELKDELVTRSNLLKSRGDMEGIGEVQDREAKAKGASKPRVTCCFC